MRVQSVKKLEKQALQYSETHPVVMPEEWRDEYDSIAEKMHEVGKKIKQIQSTCPAGWGKPDKCNCREHPNYYIVQSEIVSLETRYSNMNRERYKLQCLVYEKELSALMKMRKAKIEYLTSVESAV